MILPSVSCSSLEFATHFAYVARALAYNVMFSTRQCFHDLYQAWREAGVIVAGRASNENGLHKFKKQLLNELSTY
jgi:hypothetical protein